MATDAGSTSESGFSIEKIYIENLSFESPRAPGIFKTQWESHLHYEIASHATDLGEGYHRVVVHLVVTVKKEDQVVFLVELDQAGIFRITGFPPEQLPGVLGVFCPNILYPYAREAVSDVVTRGGFPQLLLPPVNFESLFAEQQAQAPVGDAVTE